MVLLCSNVIILSIPDVYLNSVLINVLVAADVLLTFLPKFCPRSFNAKTLIFLAATQKI